MGVITWLTKQPAVEVYDLVRAQDQRIRPGARHGLRLGGSAPHCALHGVCVEDCILNRARRYRLAGHPCLMEQAKPPFTSRRENNLVEPHIIVRR